MSSPAEAFDLSDFQSIALHLSFFNITTKTEVTDGKKYIGEQLQADASAKIDLVEFREQGLVIEVPARSGAAGHQLNVRVWTENASPNVEVKFVATVTLVQKLSPARDQFELTFNEYDSKAWRELQTVFQKRQQAINEFLLAAKGW